MARTKKAAVAATEVKETVAETVAEAVVEAPKAEEKKAPAKKTAAKKTAEKKAPAEKKPAAEKKAPAKKTAAKKATENVVIQFMGGAATSTELIEKAKAQAGVKAPKTVDIYVKPEENMVYYVVDGVTGGFTLIAE